MQRLYYGNVSTTTTSLLRQRLYGNVSTATSLRDDDIVMTTYLQAYRYLLILDNRFKINVNSRLTRSMVPNGM